MKYITILCLVWLPFTACESQQNPKNDSEQSDFAAEIDAWVKQFEALEIFSGVVLVAEKGTPVYHKAFGLSNREKNIPNTINTLFDIGSMNKTFTAVVVKQLIAEGKLKYADRLIDFVPGFKAPLAGEITVEHLLLHQSGFGDYHSPDYFDSPKSERTLAAIVERAKGMELLFPPGESDEYSNTGYVLLGAIIEKASGKSYFQNVRERIVEPLGLKNTYLQNFDPLKDRIATGYFYNPIGELITADNMQDEPNPDGGFLANTTDVMAFYRSYYYDNVLLSEETKATDPFFQYLAELEPGKAPGAAGGFEGFNTCLYQVLSDDRTIIVFANMDEPVAELIAMGILDMSRGKQPAKPMLPAVQNVRIQYEEQGTEYVKENFEELTKNYHPEDPKDWILNSLGYAYLYEKEDAKKALAFFKLNTELFPDVANAWDSYGEGLLNAGDEPGALVAYKKALELDPELPSAQEAVKELEGRE